MGRKRKDVVHETLSLNDTTKPEGVTLKQWNGVLSKRRNAMRARLALNELREVVPRSTGSRHTIITRATAYIRKLHQATADVMNSKDASNVVAALQRENDELRSELEFLKHQLRVESVVPVSLFPKRLVDASTQCDGV